jgi:hypothetical protein
MPYTRRDTRLESEGAEFLVLGHLLVEGIEAYRAYTRYPGWDVMAVNPSSSTDATCRIQVKSRWRTGAADFPIKNFDCDFVAFVCLNRGGLQRNGKPREVKPPEVYVFPVELVRAATQDSGG